MHETASHQQAGSTCKAGGFPSVSQTQPKFRQVALGITVTLLQVMQIPVAHLEVTLASLEAHCSWSLLRFMACGDSFS